MKQSKASKNLANKFRANLNFDEIKSKSGSLLLFNELTFSELFCGRFGIQEEREAFNEAFTIATGGVGNEITNVNSVISSALLPLLFFYRLFYTVKQPVSLRININGIEHNFVRAFFEVRNKVVGRPSCVDVVLQDKDGNLLFLESKLTEFLDDYSDKPKTYGASYLSLYQNASIKNALENAGIGVDRQDKVLLLTPRNTMYLEGIKQSISHLIGLVKGPQIVDDEFYPSAYCREYIEAFENAPNKYYATILFDPTKQIGNSPEFESYCKLYCSIVGNEVFRNGIVPAIREWAKLEKGGENIIIIPQPLTYQEITSANPDYPLPESIKKYYGF
ncbi:MAG: hypothetical protein Q4F07_03110 [Bacteroidales bacterium]|nr:hypothetical protein [Bacteroidales bacterium]